MHWIPDVPKSIEDQIEKENLITQQFIWQEKSKTKGHSQSSTYALSSCNSRNSKDDNDNNHDDNLVSNKRDDDFLVELVNDKSTNATNKSNTDNPVVTSTSSIT